jgi:hypothetical protein
VRADLEAFLRQDAHARTPIAETLRRLETLAAALQT